MKVVTILGSPKKEGNTAKVLGLFEELIVEGHEVDRVNIAACDVKGCLEVRPKSGFWGSIHRAKVI